VETLRVTFVIALSCARLLLAERKAGPAFCSAEHRAGGTRLAAAINTLAMASMRAAAASA
jgi:hypothetical protein